MTRVSLVRERVIVVVTRVAPAREREAVSPLGPAGCCDVTE